MIDFFSKDQISYAYKYLKNNNYNEKLNLFQRAEIAKFECQLNFEDELEKISSSLNSMFEVYQKSGDVEIDDLLAGHIENINFRYVAKSIKNRNEGFVEESKESFGRYMSNVSSSKIYDIESLNYFFDGSIYIYIVDTLWSLTAGVLLDSTLSSQCFGNRLKNRLRDIKLNMGMGNFEKEIPFYSIIKKSKLNKEENNFNLFEYFAYQYNTWRDSAIDSVISLSDNGDHAALFSLDLKSYYYNVNLSFTNVKCSINSFSNIVSGDEIKVSIFLTEILEKIHSRYYAVVKGFLGETHENNYSEGLIPIGLSSSSILANWYLLDLDSYIVNDLRPHYYGRYVDDIIIVFKNPELSETQHIKEFIKKYFTELLEISPDYPEEEKEKLFVRLKDYRLPLQKEKIILQYFDSSHTLSVLDAFKKDLQEKSSAFRFLPDEELATNLDEFAYDLIYQGSGSTIRSIIGIKENSAELSKYLHSHIVLQKLCNQNDSVKVKLALERYFKGVVLLTHSLQWEKVYQYYFITRNDRYIKKFNISIKSAISRIKFKDIVRLEERIRKDLYLYNDIALATTLGLGSIDKWSKYVQENDIEELTLALRKSNFLRHYLVSWPLINYSKFNGDLTDIKELKAFLLESPIDLTDHKIRYTPRFIHDDERQLFDMIIELYTQEKQRGGEDNFSDHTNQIECENKETKTWVIEKKETTWVINDGSAIDDLKIAIAVLKIGKGEFRNSISNDSEPNISFSRQAKLYKILNQAEKEKVDLLIFPEVAIPVSWLPFMITHARQKQIGIVFGLEHWSIKGNVFNFLIEALPFKKNNKYKSCFFTYRLKKYYAPSEELAIQEYRLKPANQTHSYLCNHHKVHWKGVSFASYNCFELADIFDRALFKSEVDFIIASASNRDIGYYTSIVDSVSRDLHCYVIHVNDARFGASSVIQPTKKDEKRKIYVEGGDNHTILTTNIDIKSLRGFQYTSHSLSNSSYKPLPPGFRHEEVLQRMFISKSSSK